MEDNELTFEKALKRLGEITAAMGSSDISLDDGFALFEEGLKLCQYCSGKLEEYQIRLEELTAEGSKESE